MIIHNWGLISYLEAREMMNQIHSKALLDGENHLIFCSHPLCYTVGSDNSNSWGVDTILTDRGGSITCHLEGQLISYFCFQVPNPALFYRKVCRAYNSFFAQILPSAKYNIKQPGWYIDNRKIASLGFRYKSGVSLHGVALNVDANLRALNRVNPCNLEGISATTLKNEGVNIDIKEAKTLILDSIKRVWSE